MVTISRKDRDKLMMTGLKDKVILLGINIIATCILVTKFFLVM